jgi:FAD/FMN-containing dehydrogenase/Fe-S oxidoreductase
MGLIKVRPGRHAELCAALEGRVRGEVRFDKQTRALYATDASNYRMPPIGVVVPRDDEDVVATVEVCREHDAAIFSRGGGTSLAGQCCNTAVAIDFGKYMRSVLSIDVERRLARVLPGTVLDTLRDEAKKHGLTFGPDPATHDRCTLGGMLGNNACGIHAIQSELHGPGARTEDNVHDLEVLTYDGLRMRVGPTSEEELAAILAAGGPRGAIYSKLVALRDRYADEIRRRFPKIPRRVSGYNLEALLPENGFDVAKALVGTESTCVTILEARLVLIDALPARALLVLGYPSVFEAADHVPRIREFRPVGLEGIDRRLVDFNHAKGIHTGDLKRLPEGKGWLFVEFGADTQEEANEQARRLMKALEDEKDAPSMHLLTDGESQAHLWAVRESGLGATAFVPGKPDTWPGWEDSAVPVDRVGDYLRALRALFDRYQLAPSLYGHFGQGCIHCRVDFDVRSGPGIERYVAFTRDAAELVTSFGGSLSGEHGDGQSRADLLPMMFGETIVEAFREFKAIWDPRGRMNPGKVVDPNARDSNLRLVDYPSFEPETHFAYPEDDGSFAHAAMRCVGVGKCRKKDTGTMCPSYMVTSDENDVTRGRGHMLFEMIKGDVITDGWRSDEVLDTLDLCLACKGCKNECPVNVDMATYKAEFMAHYYEHKRRPRHAYAFGLIHRWSRLGSAMPRLANFLAGAPGLRRVAKWVAGMAEERAIPPFAKHTFRWWFERRHHDGAGGDGAGKRRVMLWPDTFNDAFFPETLVAAVEALEHAGCEVTIPDRRLCCGRPLYDYGMLDRAERLWQETLEALEPAIREGVPLVGVEPSCVAAFRDELVNLFPGDERAKRLAKQTFTLAEALVHELDYRPPRLEGEAIVHGHCHQKAIMGMDAEEALLRRMGLEVKMLDSGCCGMAGAFGFQRDKYDVSVAAGERVLLPAVRGAGRDTLVVADGFSCREQVLQLTERQALHTAEVVQLAIHRAELAASERTPEEHTPEESHRELSPPELEHPWPGGARPTQAPDAAHPPR